MRIISLSLIWAVCLVSSAIAQDLPDDLLSKDFHEERREALREMLPKNSVAVFFSNPIRNRANDVNYTYHQDPNFFYLTGHREPHSVFLLFKEDQRAADGTLYHEILFTQPKNVQREMWSGKRLGEQGAKKKLGIDQVLSNADFENYRIDFSNFNQVLFYDFFDDVRSQSKDSANLRMLIKWFKKKAGYPLESQIKVDIEQRQTNLNLADLDVYMNALRGIKTKEELEMIEHAVRISCQGQIEVMKAIKPGMSEREIQGIHEFVFKKYHAEHVGYPSIVGAGHNGCILHYIDNYKPEVNPAEMILMDLGAEYHGYTADITRTIPINGKFSPDQKAVYDVVLKAQEAAMKICKAGTTFDELKRVTKNVVNEGLQQLGIIDDVNQEHSYYPHGCCHHIGLDVHDKGFKGPLEENMTFTIEPGIYIPENSKCDKRWWGIAVRIEDDFLAMKNTCKHLSAMAPRTTEAIEKLMSQPSPLEDFVLPDLKKSQE